MSRVKTAIVTGCVSALAATTITAGPAQAAPQGPVSPGTGIGWFSNDFGVGCSYNMTVPVNSSGMVTFWDRSAANPKAKPVYIGRAMAAGGRAAVTWWPRRTGKRAIYAMQNGERSQVVKVYVTQAVFARGGGWPCTAGPR